MIFEESLQGRPGTLSAHRCLYKKHIKPFAAQLNWMKENDEIIQFMINEWNNSKLSKNTKLALLQVLSKYVQFIGKPKLNTKKFVSMLNRSEQQREVVTLSADEARKLMHLTKEIQPDFYLVLLLALHAGLRRGEIYGLQYGDIDLKNRKIKISRSHTGPTKNGKSRVVPMSNEIFNVFSSEFMTDEEPSQTIFIRRDPNFLLKELCGEAGVPKIRFHDLRHTFASLALTNGISPKQVSTWLGHASVSTTLDLYWNLTNEKADLGFLPE